MQDTEIHRDDSQTGQSFHDPASWAQPSSSRMLTTYLADVEQMLDEQHWDLALRDAFDLPQIAVALTDPRLCSSKERCKAWCSEWIRSPGATTDSAADHERICRVLEEHAAGDPVRSADAVPSLALRRLRLRRHARNSPRGFARSRFRGDDQNAVEAIEVCTAVVEGVRRWYAHSACHNPTAQANLARLAVLR
jgi:hypothetical protein